MKIRNIILAFATALAAISTLSAQSAATERLKRELKEKNAEVNTIRCKFRQTRTVSVLANEAKKEGTFYYKRDANMSMAFNDGDYIRMNETAFEMKNGDMVNTTKISSNPMLRNLNSIIAACVSGDIENAAKGFNADIASDEKEWIVRLSPKQGRAASKIAQIEIRFDKKTMSLDRLQMDDRSGNSTRYDFYDKTFNERIDDSLFDISK